MNADISNDEAPAPFTEAEKSAVYRVIRERRDMRHFTSQPVDPTILQRVLEAAHHAPSVGLMQPWRFVRIADRDLRLRVHALVDEERRRTAAALGERQDEFMRLKVEGLLECAEVLVVALADGRERHVFGRRTLPEMDLASVAGAIQNMWLAARAEGLSMGWVSQSRPACRAHLSRRLGPTRHSVAVGRPSSPTASPTHDGARLCPYAQRLARRRHPYGLKLHAGLCVRRRGLGCQPASAARADWTG